MRSSIIGLAALFSAPATADVVNASPNGFEIRHTVNLVVTPDIAFRAFGNVAAWWNPEHTYSGSSSNLSLALTPGGCFCERFPKGGGVEHMRVAFVDPGYDVDLYISTDLKTMTEIWMGYGTIACAKADERLTFIGNAELEANFGQWLGSSRFAAMEKKVA